MRNERRLSFKLLSASRFALLVAVAGTSIVVTGCGSKSEPAADPSITAKHDSNEPVHTPSQEAQILKQAQDDKKN